MKSTSASRALTSKLLTPVPNAIQISLRILAYPSANKFTKDAIPAEFEALIKFGLMPEDKHTAVKAGQIRTWMTNFLTKHSRTQFWAVLPVIYRMISMNPNRDIWKIPTSNEVCAADWQAALVQTGVGPLVAEHFNQQNMELLTLMQLVESVE